MFKIENSWLFRCTTDFMVWDIPVKIKLKNELKRLKNENVIGFAKMWVWGRYRYSPIYKIMGFHGDLPLAV